MRDDDYDDDDNIDVLGEEKISVGTVLGEEKL